MMKHLMKKLFLFNLLVLLSGATYGNPIFDDDHILPEVKHAAMPESDLKIADALKMHTLERVDHTTSLTVMGDPTSEGEQSVTKQTCPKKCWTGFKTCFSKTTSKVKYFIDEVHELYPHLVNGANEILFWSEDLALMFGNPKLAESIRKMRLKGGEYADKIDHILEAGRNGSIILVKVSDVLKHINLPAGKEDLMTKVRGSIPTLLSLASSVRNGGFVWLNQENELAFHLNRTDKHPLIQLSMNTQWYDVISSDFEDESTKSQLGFSKDELVQLAAWKKAFNKTDVAHEVKEGLLSLVNQFAKITTVDLKEETGELLFYPVSMYENKHKDPVLTVHFQGYDKATWNPSEDQQEVPAAPQGNMADHSYVNVIIEGDEIEA